jgi:hypothetical protein
MQSGTAKAVSARRSSFIQPARKPARLDEELYSRGEADLHLAGAPG